MEDDVRLRQHRHGNFTYQLSVSLLFMNLRELIRSIKLNTRVNKSETAPTYVQHYHVCDMLWHVSIWHVHPRWQTAAVTGEGQDLLQHSFILEPLGEHIKVSTLHATNNKSYSFIIKFRFWQHTGVTFSIIYSPWCRIVILWCKKWLPNNLTAAASLIYTGDFHGKTYAHWIL